MWLSDAANSLQSNLLSGIIQPCSERFRQPTAFASIRLPRKKSGSSSLRAHVGLSGIGRSVASSRAVATVARRIVVARLHQKVRSQRKDFLHKLSSTLVGHFDLVSIEDLNVGGLAKTKLSTSVLDASWGMFRAMLTYKAERQNTHLIAIGRFFASTKRCGACGAVNANLTLADRDWRCACGGPGHPAGGWSGSRLLRPRLLRPPDRDQGATPRTSRPGTASRIARPPQYVRDITPRSRVRPWGSSTQQASGVTFCVVSSSYSTGRGQRRRNPDDWRAIQ